MTDFILHERLARGSADLGRHGICRVMLKNQAHFPWILLVPEVAAEVKDLHQLSEEDYLIVCASIRYFSQWMQDHLPIEKINVAAIGNQVPQLHIHIVGRRHDDVAWPGVVWSCNEKQSYADDEWILLQEKLRAAINGNTSC
jgi:diadenosine tetraphosphate (Ap4A) HIT family hydrolase